MAYRVDIARSAEADLDDLYLWVVERVPQQGATWFNGLERAVLSLDQHPERCPVVAESSDPDHPVRVLSYGRKPHVYASSSRLTTTLASCAWCMCGVAPGDGRRQPS